MAFDLRKEADLALIYSNFLKSPYGFQTAFDLMEINAGVYNYAQENGIQTKIIKAARADLMNRIAAIIPEWAEEWQESLLDKTKELCRMEFEEYTKSQIISAARRQSSVPRILMPYATGTEYTFLQALERICELIATHKPTWAILNVFVDNANKNARRTIDLVDVSFPPKTKIQTEVTHHVFQDGSAGSVVLYHLPFADQPLKVETGGRKLVVHLFPEFDQTHKSWKRWTACQDSETPTGIWETESIYFVPKYIEKLKTLKKKK